MDVGELLTFKPELGIKHVLEKETVREKHKSSSSGSSRKRSRLERTGNQTPNYVAQSPNYKAPSPSPRPRDAIQAIQKIASHHAQKLNSSSKSGDNWTADAERCLDFFRPLQVFDKKKKSEKGENEHMIEERLQELEDSEEQGPLDEARMKKMIHNFEKKVLKNQELRIKFPDDPKKFMESEIELHEAVEEMHVVATVPELYSLLIDLGTVKTLSALLSHENTDISIAVVDLLQEMTEVEDVENSDGIDDFVEALMEGQVVATLVHNLQRLDEGQKSEADGVHNTLGIIENLAEVRPEVCNEANPSGLMQWLLKRFKAKMPFDANKLYASEILAICVQNNTENQRVLPSLEGIDVLLQQLAQYKRHDPATSEEQEFMENLFDALSSCLLLPSNREPFLLGEGLQLMNLMLREKKLSRNGALRVLDHALCGPPGADNCNKFIDILGLRTIFPLFMKTPKKHGIKGLSKEQHEEHVISIISWLLRNSKSSQRQRLINKFTENDHEKVDRLLELHFRYLEKVIATNTALEEQARAENLDEDDVYLRRLDGGLFTIQLVDYVMLDICATGPPSIKRRVLKILNVRNASIKTIKNIIREYASNIGEGNAPEAITEEQERILELLDKFQNM